MPSPVVTAAPAQCRKTRVQRAGCGLAFGMRRVRRNGMTWVPTEFAANEPAIRMGLAIAFSGCLQLARPLLCYGSKDRITATTLGDHT